MTSGRSGEASDGDIIVVPGDDDRRIGDERLELGLDRIGIDAREDAAIDHRRRELRQRIVGMAGEQPRRHAARARQADLALAGFDGVGGLAVVGVGEPAPHRIAERPLLELLRGPRNRRASSRSASA